MQVINDKIIEQVLLIKYLQITQTSNGRTEKEVGDQVIKVKKNSRLSITHKMEQQIFEKRVENKNV